MHLRKKIVDSSFLVGVICCWIMVIDRPKSVKSSKKASKKEIMANIPKISGVRMRTRSNCPTTAIPFIATSLPRRKENPIIDLLLT